MKKKMFMMAIVLTLVMSFCVGCGKSGDRNSDEVQNQSSNNLESMVHLESADDVSAFFEAIYAPIPEDKMPAVFVTNELDLTDKDMVSFQAGIENVDHIDGITISEPMIGAIPYTAVYVRTKDADTKSIADEMIKNMDPRKWICVTAEKTLIASVGGDVFYIMADEETVQLVYESMINVAKEKNMPVTIITEKKNV